MTNSERYWKKRIAQLTDVVMTVAGMRTDRGRANVRTAEIIEASTSRIRTDPRVLKELRGTCWVKGCKRGGEVKGLCRPCYNRRRRAKLARAHVGSSVTRRRPTPVGRGVCSSCREVAPCFKRGRRLFCRECIS